MSRRSTPTQIGGCVGRGLPAARRTSTTLTDRSRLLRLLLLIQSHAKEEPVRYSPEALAAAGFVQRDPDEPREDSRLAGRRMVAWVEEREARRRHRRSER